jgi:hypothetical protein
LCVTTSGKTVTLVGTQPAITQGLFNINMQDQFDKAIIKWIIKDQQSYKVIEQPDFRSIITLLNRKITFCSADTISRRIIQLHEDSIQIVLAELERIPGKFSCTTDLWTSPAGMPFMAVTLHWINSEWRLRSILIGVDMVLK